MAFFGDLGKALGLGSTSDVAKFAANVGASYATGGAVPIQTSPFERAEPQMIVNPFEEQRRQQVMAEYSMPTVNSGSSFLGGLGQTIGSFGRDVGGFFQDISPLTSLFGGGGSIPRTNSGVASTIIRQRPDETSSSGEIMGANLGLGGALLQAGRSLARSPAGQSALGFGAGALAGGFMDGGSSAPRITRRMKSDVRRIYMTAQILNNMGTYPRMNFDASLVFFILTKRFRNDGPVVTKAAVRKTRSTLRRMKGIVDTYNSVCKPTTRRAPMRRAAPKAVQLIKN